MAKALTRDDIAKQKAGRKPYIKAYEVCSPDPAGGDERVQVYCRDMDSADYTYRRLLDSRWDDKGKRLPWRFENFNQLVAVHSICDETGERLYSEEDLKADWWAGLFAGYKADLVSVAMDHNGLSVGYVRVDEKNSDAAVPRVEPKP